MLERGMMARRRFEKGVSRKWSRQETEKDSMRFGLVGEGQTGRDCC